MQAQACLPVMHKLNAKVSLIHRFGNNGVIKKTQQRVSIFYCVCLWKVGAKGQKTGAWVSNQQLSEPAEERSWTALLT